MDFSQPYSRLERPLRRRSTWILAAGLAIFVAVVSLQYLHKIQSRSTRSAFLRWNSQIEALWQGHNIWDKYAYPNPPMMALVLSPFVVLPDRAGALLWFEMKLLMAVLAVYWTSRMLESKGAHFPLWGKIAGFLLVLRPIEGDLVHGNVNLFILFALAAGFYAFFRRRDFLAGMWLALAIACKLTPLLFLPYLAWKRAWRTLAGSFVGLLLFGVLLPGSIFGMAKNLEYLKSWGEQMIVPFVIEGKVTSEHNNQSLPGLAYRLCTKSPSFSDFEGDVYVPLAYHNLVDLDPHFVRVGLKVLMLLFAAIVVWSCRTPVEQRDARLLAEFSIVVLGMLLFSERTWKHHCVTLLFPLGVLGFFLSNPGGHRLQRLVSCSILASAALLITATSTGLFGKHDEFGKLAQTYGAYTWAFFLLTGGMVYVLRAAYVGRSSDVSDVRLLQARASLTTEPNTRGSGLPARSMSGVSGSKPSR